MSSIRTLVTKISLHRSTTVAPTTIKRISQIRQLSLSKPIGFRQSGQRLHDAMTDHDDHVYDREFIDMKVEDFAELYQNNSDNKERVKTILTEYEYLKYNTIGRVPSVLSVSDMQRLIEEGKTEHTRNSILHFLFKREMDKRASYRKREQQRRDMQAKREAKALEFFKLSGNRRTGLLSDDGKILYGLWHNSLFCRIPDNKIKSGLSSSRLINAALFGRKLIFDFDYEDYMSKWTYRNAIDQVQEAYGLNKYQYQDPFDIWFCNLKQNSFAREYCENNAIKNLHSGSLITVKENCFTNYFDKSRLVYLSPNAKEPLGKINKSDDIYIIGVFNDKGNQQPVSHRKALKLGIRTKSLPLDSHIAWQGPSKSLCVNHVTGILLEVMANGGDWQAAFMKHIPRRKIKPIEVVMEEEKRRLMNFKNKRKMGQFSLRNDLD